MSEPHAQPVADRNLLFGILALQMDFISRDALIAGMNAWVLDKTKPLGQILCEQGRLRRDAHEVLEALVQKHLELHGNDAEKSLASLSSVGSVKEQLHQLADPDLHVSLGHLSVKAVADDQATQVQSVTPAMRFRVLRSHAKGGLGEVFVALDEDLHREVALKEIKAERANDTTSRERFLREAEITGRLEHPGVVPVYGLGTYADGRPFYAMRFIKGDNLKQAIEQFHGPSRERERADGSSTSKPLAHARGSDFQSLEFRRLLQRFVDVCNAVAYAHSRGVLHRDLKPGNIMLGPYGETLVVDWGLAKPVGAALGDPDATTGGTLRPESGSGVAATQAGSIVGTPAYMSPEQAAGALDQLGPASDVYSLGATLYSLLTGQAPFQYEKDKPDIVERVRKGEFRPPRQANKRVPAALEAVCLKAMALKPEERYASPKALTDDLERWLADESVAAYREPLSAQARRWIRKHSRTAAGLAASLIVGLAGLSAGLFFVNAERARTALARQDAENQAELARKNEKEAKEREAETRAVLDFVVDKVVVAAMPKNHGGLGHDVTLRRALESALPHVERSFTGQPLVEARLRMTIGDSFSLLHEDEIAVDQYIKARTLYSKHCGPDHPNTLRCMHSLAVCYSVLGRNAEALKLREETLALRKAKLGTDHIDTLSSMANLANSYAKLGRHGTALKLREETLALRRAKLGPDHAETLASMGALASSYTALGREVEALKLREKTLALERAKLGLNHALTLVEMHELANMYSRLGRHAEALKLNEETLALRKANFGPDHNNTLASMHNLANSYSTLGRHADALKLREETLALRKAKLGLDDPDTLQSMWGVAASLVKLDRGTEAVPIIDECLARAAGKVVGPRLIPTIMELRLRHFEKAEDAAGCRATAEMWEKLDRTDADSQYNAACFRAVTAAVIGKSPEADAARLAREQADLAMDRLRKAVAAGYKNAAHIKKDKDLDPLRQREDFKQLLAEVEAKNAAKETPKK